jgi:hypothetical protein
VLEKLRRLCVAGATVILIHHATKADPEQYRDSGAIGANVDFMFAVVGAEPENGVKRVRMIGRPSRGAQPPTLNLIAFPALIELGKFTLEDNPPKADLERIVEYVASCPNGANKRGVRDNVKGISNSKKDAALEDAVKCGLLEQDSTGVFSVPRGRAHSTEFFGVPQAGHAVGTVADEMPL